MPNINDFFHSRNTIKAISNSELNQTANYLEVIKAFARTTYKSIYVIDYQKKGFEYVSENPLFLCGHSADEVKEMGYSFYFNYVTKTDLDLILKINTVGFDFYESIPIAERIKHTISCDFQIKNRKGKTILINQKSTPLFLNEKGKIWKAICLISLSAEQHSGNIQIYKDGGNKVHKFSLKDNFWKVEDRITLTNREKEVLQYSTRGYTINEIAKAVFLSPDTIKFHRKRLFEKLEVTNISEAITYVERADIVSHLERMKVSIVN